MVGPRGGHPSRDIIMSTPLENPPMTADEALLEILSNLMDWRKQVQQGQDTGRISTTAHRQEWMEHFHNWFKNREG